MLRWPTVPAREWALNVFPKLCAEPNVKAVVLLGSTVRAAESSFDFDCLFVYSGGKPAFTRPPSEVDIRAFDAEQMDALIQSAHDLLVWSLRLGELVCEHNEYWSTLKRHWQDRLPFPSADVAEARAEKAQALLDVLRSAGDDDAVVEQLVSVLTHRARAALLRAEIFPASRPELPDQLRGISEDKLAIELQFAIRARNTIAHQLIKSSTRSPDAA